MVNHYSGVPCPWSEYEKTQLAQMYEEGIPWKQMATLLEKTVDQCRKQVKRMGIRSGHHSSWTQQRDEKLLSLSMKGNSWKDIGKQLDQHQDTCRNRFHTLMMKQLPGIASSNTDNCYLSEGTPHLKLQRDEVLNVETLQSVFQTRPGVLTGIQKAADTPARIGLFNDIASFVYERIATASDHAPTQVDGPAAKRRRVNIAQAPSSQQRQSNGNAAGGGVSVEAAASEQVLLEIKDISVSVPQDNKYDLCFTKHFLYAKLSGTTAPVQGIVYPWKDIEHTFYLPVPEKSMVQHDYVVFPQDSYFPTWTGKPTAGVAPVFTVPAAAPKPGSVEAVPHSYSTLFHWALATSLKSAGNRSCSIVASDPKLFHSVTKQAHRPQEKAVPVKAFRGGKDGYLFFLPTGILWGFKKPIVFLPLDRIAALSFTSLSARTFNIVVELDVDESGSVEKEIEFSMLDKEDFEGVNAEYV